MQSPYRYCSAFRFFPATLLLMFLAIASIVNACYNESSATKPVIPLQSTLNGGSADPVRIRLVSDLHTDIPGHASDFQLSQGDENVIVVAGDIGNGLKGIDWLNHQVLSIPVIYVLGNHEYWNGNFKEQFEAIKRRNLNPNVYILEKECMDIKQVRFHATTLWTDFRLSGNQTRAFFDCADVLNDFENIRLPDGNLVKPIHLCREHEKSLEWLRESLANSDQPYNVVVTHHAPLNHSIDKVYLEDEYLIHSSAGFASDLSDFVLQTVPNLWIHGHVHQNNDYTFGETRVVCNPRGYPDENPHFQPNLIVQLPQ